MKNHNPKMQFQYIFAHNGPFKFYFAPLVFYSNFIFGNSPVGADRARFYQDEIETVRKAP